MDVKEHRGDLYQQLRGFYHVAKCGNFTKAAERMGRNQPTLSLLIKALEEELGVKLFERRGHKTSLTPEGNTLLEHVLSFFAGIDSMKKTMEEAKGSCHEPLVIAATPAIIQFYLPEKIIAFKGKNPMVEFRLLEKPTQEIVSLAVDGEITFGIASLIEIPKNMIYKGFLSYDFSLITSLDHPLAKQKKVSLKDIVEYPLILYHKNFCVRQHIDEILGNKGLSYKVIMELESASSIKKYVELGMGVSILPSISISSVDRLKVFSLRGYFRERSYGILLRKGKYIPQAGKEFIRTLAPDFSF